ncbi:hypothetical protein GQX74_014896 [Glossina fuscipes]|nr:hypothetical protein GQX74_014896 [Glossina fuscipes]
MAEKLFIATVLLHSLPLVNLTGVVLRDSSKTEFSKLIRSSSDMAPASFAAIAAVSRVRELNRGNSEIVNKANKLCINSPVDAYNDHNVKVITVTTGLWPTVPPNMPAITPVKTNQSLRQRRSNAQT